MPLDEKPSLESLAIEHFGVKGMHWGVRKVGGATDRVLFGKKGVARIEDRVASGQSASAARWSQSGRVAARAVILAYGVMVAKNVTQVGLNTAVASKFAQRGQESAMAISATAAATKFAKKRGGAFVITTMT